MKLIIVIGVILGVFAAGGALLVAASGVIPIKASAGHFAITEWFLQFSKQRSVATHTLGLEPPPLDDPALVVKGAGQFEGACKPCHGSPELRNPRVPAAMLPPPPNLAERIPAWQPEELFYIVKHGIKFTGMPAWPAQQRDDEVWAMVAFLLEYPALDAGAYRRLVHSETADSAQRDPGVPLGELSGAPQRPKSAAVSCERCHGASGEGRAGAFPRLAGQRAEYLRNSLEAYASGARHSGIMGPVAAALTESEVRELADYYARVPAVLAAARVNSGDESLRARGRELAARGVPEDNIPACADCHGPEPKKRNSAFPRIEGQSAAYLALQLDLLRERRRGGSEYVHVMHKVTQRLTAAQVQSIAAYYGSLAWNAEEQH